MTERWIMVVDAQGGGLGRQLIDTIKKKRKARKEQYDLN